MKEKNKEKKVKTRKKLSTKFKKVLVLCSFCALLLITGGVNILINNLASQEASAEVISTTANFFSNYRTDRQDTRNQEILYLDAIIASEATSAEARANAEAEKLELIANMELALKIENLIMSKGFEDVVISTSSGNISVMVETSGLTTAEVAQIVDVVLNNSDYSIDNIKIIEV